VYEIILASIFDPRYLWSAPNCFMGREQHWRNVGRRQLAMLRNCHIF